MQTIEALNEKIQRLQSHESVRLTVSEYAAIFGVGAEGWTALRTFLRARDCTYRWSGPTLLLAKGGNGASIGAAA